MTELKPVKLCDNVATDIDGLNDVPGPESI